ncbi:MAG TPA: cytochrome P450, partial [Trebonia sp.]|nr:cytochrome P450 [Trebonia sp.]
RVVALRGALFTLVNGEEGLPVLQRPAGAADFLRVYGDPGANGRSHGAGLSDLFWYWLAPGPEVHQEHLEPGPRYDQAARTTRAILASRTKAQWAELVTRCTAHVLEERFTDTVKSDVPNAPVRLRLRDLMMPVWAEVYYELVFAEPCPREARDLIVANADDVVSALKCTTLRHMRRRDRLTRYLRGRIGAGQVPFELPGLMTTAEQAYYLQGAFFNTAVVQMSEAMAHLLLAIAQHPGVQDRLRADPGDEEYLSDVINEALRAWPLFGIAHRITTASIDVDPPIPAGSVVLFDYPGFHGDPAEFDPDRWRRESARTMNFIPFGVSANRPCPARGVAPVGMRAATREVLRRFALSSSVTHTRSLPNRAPVLFTPVGAPRPSASRLRLMRLGDRWEDVTRSLTQLALGTVMVLDARRLALCRTYFAEHPEHLPVPATRAAATGAATTTGPGPAPKGR